MRIVGCIFVFKLSLAFALHAQVPNEARPLLAGGRPSGVRAELCRHGNVNAVFHSFRYRNSLLKPELMQPGKVYEITVDLGPVAATITKGHQLRVDISGADFPLYDRNPNTAEGIFGSQTTVATERVHHKPGALSRIVLPVK
jgi:hypothetical protein